MLRDNPNNDEALVRTVERNLYMDDFLKSVKTPAEGIDIYENTRSVLSKCGFKLNKWITSNEYVKWQIQ